MEEIPLHTKSRRNGGRISPLWAALVQANVEGFPLSTGAHVGIRARNFPPGREMGLLRCTTGTRQSRNTQFVYKDGIHGMRHGTGFTSPSSYSPSVRYCAAISCSITMRRPKNSTICARAPCLSCSFHRAVRYGGRISPSGTAAVVYIVCRGGRIVARWISFPLWWRKIELPSSTIVLKMSSKRKQVGALVIASACTQGKFFHNAVALEAGVAWSNRSRQKMKS